MTKKTETIVVIYIITKLELGGAQKVCLTLFNDIQKSNITTYLISGSEGKLTPEVQNNTNAMLISSLKREVSWRMLFNEVKVFFDLIKQLKSIKKKHPQNTIFMVHTHSTKAGIMGRWAAFFARIPWRVHTIHGYGFHKHQFPIIRWCMYGMECITSLITTHFVCVSTDDANKGSRIFPRFKNKFSIIRAGVEWEQFYRPAIKIDLQKNTFVYGTVSCFKPQKNLFDLLKAFQLVYNNNPIARLEIIGDGILRPEIEQWISQNRLEHVVTLHGWQNPVSSIMQTWNAFVLSSLWEGLPCSVVEARLLKLPVISYDTGGIHEIIFHGKNGFLLPQKQWHKLAYGMLDVSHNPHLFQKLCAYEDTLDEFKNTYMVAQHTQLYEKLVK